MSLKKALFGRKLLVINLSVGGVVFLMTCMAFFATEFWSLRQMSLRQISTLGALVAADSTAALASGNRDKANEVLVELKNERRMQVAAIYDKNGKLFSGYPATLAAGALPAARQPDGCYFESSQLFAFLPILRGRRRLGTLYLRYDMKPFYERLWSLGIFAAVAFVIFLLITAGVSMGRQRQISEPILRLADTAKAVSVHRDYSVRAPDKGDGELRLLTDAFHQMLAQIQASLKEVGDLKTALDEHAIVAVTDPKGRITYVNDKFCAISKYSREELLGQDHRLVNSGHHSKDFMRTLWTTIAQGRVWKGEIRNRARDGTFYWVDTTIVPFLGPDGHPSQYVAIRTDITKRKHAEQEVRTLNADLERRVRQRTAQLEEINKELEAFAYSVSHDLRVPLRHIDGFVALLRDSAGPGLSAQSRHHLDVIADSARRMSRLIEDLLVFSRVGRAEMQRSSVRLDDLVEETIESLLPETKGRNVLWRKAELPVVNADRSMMRQVFVNLLSNAVKYTRPRNPAEIEIGCRNGTAGETVIFVRDNGVGFDMEYAGKLFGVFQRLHSEDEFEGTGIGLASVRRVIVRHGDRAWAEGKVDAGATFYFSLLNADVVGANCSEQAASPGHHRSV